MLFENGYIDGYINGYMVILKPGDMIHKEIGQTIGFCGRLKLTTRMNVELSATV